MLPELIARARNTTMLNAFLGINKNLQIQEAEFSDMKNMTNDYFPVIGNRKQRGIVGQLTNPQGILGGRYLAYVDNNKLYYDESYVCDLEELNVERQLVMMGAYLCVFPDGLIYNTESYTFDSVENEKTASGVQISLCKYDGTSFDSENTVTGATAPEDRTKYWMDTSGDSVILKMYSETYSMWTSVATTYVKFVGTGIGEGFSPYDGVRFEGVDAIGYNDYDFNTTNIIFKCGQDWVMVAGLIEIGEGYHVNSTSITLKREMPDLDFVCELDNRLWGCSSRNHEIYSCKLGDPKNWNCFAGLDSDSYAATVGTHNVFTGCVSYSGYVYFFKEDGYHRLFGTKPSEYQMIWKPGRGVQQGSEKSIAIVNEMMFFKARDAVCVYDGSIESISSALGTETYYDAVGGAYRNKYYISMRDDDYNWRVYVYDTTKGTWVVEEDIQLKYMAYANNGTYIVDYDNNMFVINNEKIFKKIFPMDPTVEEKYLYSGEDVYPGNIINGDLEGTFEWYVVSGDMGMDSANQKYVKNINIRFELKEESKLKIEIMYDSSGDWEKVMEYYCTRKKSYEFPVQVKRCDHFKLRLSGWGDVRIYSIAKTVEEGSGL